MLKVHTTNFGNVAVLCVQGRIVRGETDVLRRAVLAQANATVVVFDLARVNIIDAGDWACCWSCANRLDQREWSSNSRT